MRLTKYFMPTLRKDPKDAEIPSHRLMLRSGMIRKVSSGIYTYLPLGLRSIRKFENIVREEMNRAGAIEILMPIVQPAELWKESGRWDYYGKELLRFKDRGDRDFCLAPTHEELVTDLVRREVRSYRDLPLNLYQIYVKFRDEVRPRFGVMRAREFIMKDAYSFDRTEEDAEGSYWNMYDTYNRIFERVGLEFRAVEADTGLIGGRYSHEFMVLASTGEDRIAICRFCGYAANVELSGRRVVPSVQDEVELPAEDVHTPGISSVEDVSGFLKVPKEKIVKAMVFRSDEGPILALVRGDREVSPAKVRNLLGLPSLEMAERSYIEDECRSVFGFTGPIGFSGRIVADEDIRYMKNFVVGSNKADYHIRNVNHPRDFSVDTFGDISTVREGDGCPKCENGILEIVRGIEVGHIFMLGTKYSEAMGATFVDEDGKEKPIIMGCYGIGIGRTVAAAIEQRHDRDGMILPMSISPFHVYLLVTNVKDGSLVDVSDRLYEDLVASGVEVLYDDRDERPGVKFKDADLVGFPIRVTVGERFKKEGKVEMRFRDTGEVVALSPDELPSKVKEVVYGSLRGKASQKEE